jgi:hypothetical protein
MGISYITYTCTVTSHDHTYILLYRMRCIEVVLEDGHLQKSISDQDETQYNKTSNGLLRFIKLLRQNMVLQGSGVTENTDTNDTIVCLSLQSNFRRGIKDPTTTKEKGRTVPQQPHSSVIAKLMRLLLQHNGELKKDQQFSLLLQVRPPKWQPNLFRVLSKIYRSPPDIGNY